MTTLTIMFKKLILFIAVTALFSVSHAQRRGSAANGFDYELRAGANLCQIDGDASGHYNKIGFHAGVGTSMPISDDGNWRFCVEIGLSQKGSRIVNSSMDRNISLLYVEVPLLIAYDLLENHNLRIGVGMAPAILAKSKVTTDKTIDNQQSNNYKRFDALPLMASIRYRFTDHFGLQVRYCNSMLNTAKENGSGTYRIFRSNKGQFNRLIQAGITLSF